MKKILLLFAFAFLMVMLFASYDNSLKEKTVGAEYLSENKSKAELLYDAKSGTVIYEKNSSERLPIASMTKLASLMLVFDAIEEGKIKEDDLIKISKHSAETEGSSAFLDEKSEYKISDLIMTVIVCSANDSTVALAEAVSGSEENFVKLMNDKVKDMGLKNTNFINSTGLPAVDHYSSAYDISKIYSKICDNKIYKKYSKIWMTELVHPSGRKTEVVNTNRLIKTYEGCDSGKTGFTNDAGYCLASSATRNGMRLIGVVIGAKDSKTRFKEMTKLFNYGFDNYENKVVIDQCKPLKKIDIKNAKTKEIEVYSAKDYVKFLKKGEKFEYSLSYKIDKEKAPFKSGDIIGRLYVLENNIVVHEEDLIVRDDVQKIKIKDILNKIYKEII